MTGTRAFIVERYWPGASAKEFQALTERLATSVSEQSARGLDVELLHSTYVPADEAAQWVVRADTVDLVEDACAAAALTFQRLLPVVDSALPAVELGT